MKMLAFFQRDYPPVTFLLILLVASRLGFSFFVGYTHDDAFIMYRFAENLAQGNGLVFNQGERVQGFSSPLYTFLMSGFLFPFNSEILPTFSRIFSLFMDAVTLLLLSQIIADFHSLSKFIVLSLFTLYPKAVFISMSGMETALVVMLMMLFLYYLQKEKYSAASVTSGFLLLGRIDTIVWIIACLGVIMMFKQTRLKSIVFVVPGLMYGSWLVFSAIYFGSVIPHSIVAKNASWQHMFPLFDPIRVLLGYFPFRGLSGASPVVSTLVAIVFLLPVISEGLHLLKRREIMAIFPVFFLLYNVFFSFGRIVMADWYYLPGYVSYFVTLGSFVNRIIQSPRIAFFVRPRAVHSVVICVLIVLLTAGFIRWSEDPGKVLLHHKELGSWLSANGSARSSIMIEPIGYVGWISKLYVHDYIGLVSPQVIEYRKKFEHSDKWFLEYIKDYQPDFIALRNWEIPRNTLFHGYGDGMFRSESDRRYFEGHYTQVYWNDAATVVDSVYLVLYRRVLTQ